MLSRLIRTDIWGDKLVCCKSDNETKNCDFKQTLLQSLKRVNLKITTKIYRGVPFRTFSFCLVLSILDLWSGCRGNSGASELKINNGHLSLIVIGFIDWEIRAHSLNVIHSWRTVASRRVARMMWSLNERARIGLSRLSTDLTIIHQFHACRFFGENNSKHLFPLAYT